MSYQSKLRKAITQPYKIPGWIYRQTDRMLHTVEGSRVVWPSKGRALLESFALRHPTGDEILVKMHTTLVSSGTERAMFAAMPNTNVEYPYYPGYSGAGEVIMVGEKVQRFRPGDWVASTLPHATLHLIHQDLATLLPAGVAPEDAAIYQVGIIALQGVRKAQIQLGERVAVLGSGLIGQLAVQLAAASGAYPITGIASSARRLALMEQSGAHAVLDLSQDADQLDMLLADVTIEATGNPDAIHTAIRCTRPGGRIVLLGSNRGISHALDFSRICKKDQRLIGAHIMTLPQSERRPGWWPAAREAEIVLNLLNDDRLHVRHLITEEVHPAEAERFYRNLARGDQTAPGTVFRWTALPEEQRLTTPKEQALAEIRRIYAARRAPAAVAAVTTPQGKDANVLRIGLIGCGEIAIANARAIHESRNAVITAVMDVNASVAADLARRYDVPYTTESTDLLARADVDAVLISVPHFLHAPLTIAAAKQGKHVMVEKPMANSVAEADAMIEACNAAGVTLSVIYCQRYLPYVQKAKSLIDQGALGRLLGVNLLHYLDKPMSYWNSGHSGRVATDWRLSKEKSGGGIVVFNLVHYLDMIGYLTGCDVRQVFTEMGTFDSPSETEDTVSVSLRYSNQVIGNITAASCVRGANLQHQQLHIWGTDGQIIVGEPFRFYSLRQVDGHKPGEWHTISEWPWGVERRAYVERFAAAVLNGAPLEIDGSAGRAVQATVEAIYTSAQEARPVTIDPVQRPAQEAVRA